MVKALPKLLSSVLSTTTQHKRQCEHNTHSLTCSSQANKLCSLVLSLVLRALSLCPSYPALRLSSLRPHTTTIAHTAAITRTISILTTSVAQQFASSSATTTTILDLKFEQRREANGLCQERQNAACGGLSAQQQQTQRNTCMGVWLEGEEVQEGRGQTRSSTRAHARMQPPPELEEEQTAAAVHLVGGTVLLELSQNSIVFES